MADEDAGGFEAGAVAAPLDEDRLFDPDPDDAGDADAAATAAPPLAVTSGVIFLIVAAETPALDKSLAEE